jgi:hypothetical protein
MGRHRILIGKRWSLESLTVFSRTYEQTYAFYYSFAPEVVQHEESRLFAAFPWRGGYSAVNFYGGLRRAVPRKRRPRVLAIQYASPGYIDLALLLAAAFAISRTVRHLAATLRESNAAYNEIMRDISRRKLGRIRVQAGELDLKSKQLKVINDHIDTAARLLRFKETEKLSTLTGHPFITLKVLLSLYRRTRTLAEFVASDKVEFKSSEEE